MFEFLYDVNFKRDYHEIIRQWIFKNNLTSDSLVIEDMNSLLRQFNYSGKNENCALSPSVPIVTSLLLISLTAEVWQSIS